MFLLLFKSLYCCTENRQQPQTRDLFVLTLSSFHPACKNSNFRHWDQITWQQCTAEQVSSLSCTKRSNSTLSRNALMVPTYAEGETRNGGAGLAAFFKVEIKNAESWGWLERMAALCRRRMKRGWGGKRLQSFEIEAVSGNSSPLCRGVLCLLLKKSLSWVRLIRVEKNHFQFL